MIEGFNPALLEVYDSPAQGFRMRAEFRIWHNQDDCFYAMFEAGKKASHETLIPVDEFPIAHHSIQTLMQPLLNSIKQAPLLRSRLYQIEFLATLSGQLLVSLIYHKKLDKDWLELARQLEAEFGIFIIGRSRKQKLVISQDYVVERLTINNKNYIYKQIEGGFTQPNACVCQKMIEWALDCVPPQSKDLLELYCGNGNFTLPLAQKFNRVLATEVSKTSVAAALFNSDQNNITNIKIARLSSEEFVQAYNKVREFKRLKLNNINLSEYNFSCVFIDPPRAGLDALTTKLVAQFDCIIYISCNPISLCRDLKALIKTHKIERCALFDQFPFTPHIESGVLLVKN